MELSLWFPIVKESSYLIFWAKSRRAVCWKRKFWKHASDWRNIVNKIFKQGFQSKGRKLDPAITKSILERLFMKLLLIIVKWYNFRLCLMPYLMKNVFSVHHNWYALLGSQSNLNMLISLIPSLTKRWCYVESLQSFTAVFCEYCFAQAKVASWIRELQ